MIRRFILGCVVILALSGSSYGQRPPRSRPGGPRVAQGGPPGAKKGKQGGLRPNRTIVDRWNGMAPEERRRALAKLPPERRKHIERELQNFRDLSPEERRQLRSRYNSFNQLPEETQNEARKLFRQFSQLPEGRRQPVRSEFEQLRRMSPADREARMKSPEFAEKFNSREKDMLRDLSGLVPPAE